MDQAVDWLDQHSGSITALATILLAILTGVYVYMTHQIAVAAQEQTRSLAAERADRRRTIVHAALSVRDRIREALEKLPGDRQRAEDFRNVVLWTHEDLRDLEFSCRRLGTGPAVAASSLVADLRRIESWHLGVQATPVAPGFDWSRFPWDDYVRCRNRALARLEDLLDLRPASERALSDARISAHRGEASAGENGDLDLPNL